MRDVASQQGGGINRAEMEESQHHGHDDHGQQRMCQAAMGEQLKRFPEELDAVADPAGRVVDVRQQTADRRESQYRARLQIQGNLKMYRDGGTDHEPQRDMCTPLHQLNYAPSRRRTSM